MTCTPPPPQSPTTARRARGPYREPTTPVRVPRSLLAEIQAMLDVHRQKQERHADTVDPHNA
jgi:hypothetical protein